MTEALWFKFLCVATAGAIGALTRWGLSLASAAIFGSRWPYGTLVVNVLGCFLFGLCFGVLQTRYPPGSHLHLLLLTGFMGALTTFSTFAFETYELQVHHGAIAAGVNIAVQLLLGLTALVVGLSLARTVWS